MLALLVYRYATGRSAGRRIESTLGNIEVRYLCGVTHHEYGTITNANEVLVVRGFVTQ